MKSQKAAVFILLGQSNAVGHGVPMKKEDIIDKPLKNVFGLSRAKNQSFENTELCWSGYTSHGMNLAEEQDNTYSVANCLAALWQEEIDKGAFLPDLHIIQIAIGAQGVTDKYMWFPQRENRLIPGVLGTVDISLYPFSMHIFSLLDESFEKLGKDYEIIGLHWRGGEEDTQADDAVLSAELQKIYSDIINGFNKVLNTPPVVMHRICAHDRMNEVDPTGKQLERMNFINTVFEKLQASYENVSLFDVRKAPQFIPDVRCNGIFIEDAVHFKPEVNNWVASSVLENYKSTKNN